MEHNQVLHNYNVLNNEINQLKNEIQYLKDKLDYILSVVNSDEKQQQIKRKRSNCY